MLMEFILILIRSGVRGTKDKERWKRAQVYSVVYCIHVKVCSKFTSSYSIEERKIIVFDQQQSVWIHRTARLSRSDVDVDIIEFPVFAQKKLAICYSFPFLFSVYISNRRKTSFLVCSMEIVDAIRPHPRRKYHLMKRKRRFTHIL